MTDKKASATAGAFVFCGEYNSGVPAVLEYEHITKTYRSLFGRGSVRALNDFSLSIQAGEIFGFLGPNGAGKSTAIHLAMGFMRPSSGAGQLLGKEFGYAPVRRRVGFLAENVALYNRPVKDLVRFYGALNGMRDPELAKRTSEVLELLELRDVESRKASKLSRGMLQRVGLAQALVNDPELLILDEPTSALDPLGRVAVRELLIRVRNAGKAVFLSSHLLSEIEMISDRVAIMNKGKLMRVGKTSELLESAEESEIVASGVMPAEFPGAESENGNVVIKVKRAEQRRVIEQIWATGGEVLRVNPVRRSLEELFLELTTPSAEREAIADREQSA
jgi:ABC-2 type transport system ATP-binding protein